MNKKELIEAIADETGITQSATTKMINAFQNIVYYSLNRGKPVVLTGFGKFDVQHRKARRGRNPSTGESIEIAAKNVVKFTPGATLAKSVNE